MPTDKQVRIMGRLKTLYERALAEFQARPELARLFTASMADGRARYVPDSDAWGELDRFSTWGEIVAHEGGQDAPLFPFDCEDDACNTGACAKLNGKKRVELGIIEGENISHAVCRVDGIIRDHCVSRGMGGNPDYGAAFWEEV